MATQLLTDAVLNWAGSGESFASDPVFLGVFFVLGYRKLFSETSTTTVGSIILLTTLSVAAACFVRSVGAMSMHDLLQQQQQQQQHEHAPAPAPTHDDPPQAHDRPSHGPPRDAAPVNLHATATAFYQSLMMALGTKPQLNT